MEPRRKPQNGVEPRRMPSQLAPDLERHLLRRGVGARDALRDRCHDCGRTPLVGEQVHVYPDERLVCALCRPLRREEPPGRGAGAGSRAASPATRFGWADQTLVEVDPPYRIVEKGRGGKYNRIRSIAVYPLSPAAGGTTKAELTYETEPPLVTDRIM